MKIPRSQPPLLSPKLSRVAAALLCAGALTGFLPAAETNRSSPAFGFSGPEVFPIENFLSDLRSADIDGDGLKDLIVVNNARSKITLLYNQTGRTNRVAAPSARTEINELPADARFRIDSIASEKRIASLAVGDLNRDGRPDIAYYGEPRELVVQHNLGTNGWSSPKRWPIEDGQLTQNGLVTGDLNGDGRTDLLLLAENHIHVFTQQADGSLAEPEKTPFASPVKAMHVLDINGDDREDLLLVNWEATHPFRIRLQNAAGRLGPEFYFNVAPIRSFIAEDLDGDHKTETITIAQNSGRAQVSHFVRKPAADLVGTFKQGQFQVLPLAKTTKARRGTAWADLNGDGRADLLVAEPDSGQLTLYLQQPDGTLSGGKTFPTLTGVSELAVIAAQKGQPAEVFVLSGDERQVGVAQYDQQGRLPFPTRLSAEGRPLALALGALKTNERPSLAVVLDQEGKRALFLRTPDGKTRTQKLGDNFKSNPASMAWHDLDHDGLADLVILIPYEKLKVLRQVAGKDFEEIDVAPPGGAVEQPWMSAADVDGDGRTELLLAQKNFLRAVILQSDGAREGTNQTWSFHVKDQINGAASNSRIVGAASLRNGTNAIASLFLLDAERKTLTLSERDTNGVWQVVRNLPLPFTEFTALEPVALGGTQPNTVAFLGLNSVAWLPLRGDTWDIVALDGYETPIKDGRLNDSVAGDLNQDGRKDLVFLETAKHYLDLVIFDKTGHLVPANRWQVFEERTFRGRTSDQLEPREALIVDVTGDGKNDLVVLVHDRLLVYPQE